MNSKIDSNYSLERGNLLLVIAEEWGNKNSSKINSKIGSDFFLDSCNLSLVTAEKWGEQK